MSKLTKLFKNPKLFFQDALINRNKKIAFIFGFSAWKSYMSSYFGDHKLIYVDKNINHSDFLNKYHPFINKNKNRVSFYVWSYKYPEYLNSYAEDNGLKINFVEDGFVRSINLGATKEPPFSLTIDSKAPYFDATKSSDLEDLLNSYHVDDKLLLKAERAIDFILKNKISKYNKSPLIDNIYPEKKKKRVLVIGQVEDDASIKYGSLNPLTNNELVRLAFNENPDSELIYKPHPDVINGHRDSFSNNEEIKSICLILPEVSLSQSLETIDHVYTQTSLAGFEALLRGIKVTVTGCPFYAGWGLTDSRQSNSRRTRNLSIKEIFAISYLVYPKYFDLKTGRESDFFSVANEISKKKNSSSFDKISTVLKNNNVDNTVKLWKDFNEVKLVNGISDNIELSREIVYANGSGSLKAAVWLLTRLKDINSSSEIVLGEVNSIIKMFDKNGASQSEGDKRLRSKLDILSIGLHAQAGKVEKVISLYEKLKKENGSSVVYKLTWYVNYLLYEIGLSTHEWSKKCWESYLASIESQKDFENYLFNSDSNLAVVGNSPCEIGTSKGEEIDSSDVVIRFNNYSTDFDHVIDYGRKCNVWVKAGGYADIWRRTLNKDTYIVFSGPDRRFHAAYPMDAIELIRQGYKVAFIPSKIYSTLANELNYPPSAGLLLSFWLRLIRGNPRVGGYKLHGFGMGDQEENKSAHYYENLLRKNSYSHNWQAEANLISKRILEMNDE